MQNIWVSSFHVVAFTFLRWPLPWLHIFFSFFLSSFLIRVTSINLDGLGAFVYMREGEKWGSNMKNATSRECLISYFLFCFICFPSELGSIHGVRELSLSLRHVAETFFFPSFLFVWGFLLFPSRQHGIAITQRVQSFFCLFFPFFLERRGNTKGYIERDVGGKRTQVGFAIHFFAPFIHSCLLPVPSHASSGRFQKYEMRSKPTLFFPLWNESYATLVSLREPLLFLVLRSI